MIRWSALPRGARRASRMVAMAGLAAITTAGAQPEGGDAAAALKSASAFESIGDPRTRSVALFTEAGKVLQHPRCLNCHPAGDRPLQGEAGVIHQPPVQRGADGFGAIAMRCAACHGRQNFEATAQFTMPGSKDWHLAPIEMAWVGRSLGAICTQLKDRRRNGGKTMDQIVEHMAHDELVGWGWQPGLGRAPAPGTQAQFGDLIKAWADSGAHCPPG